MKDYPEPPEKLSGYSWRICVPDLAAREIGRAESVYRLPESGWLVCPAVERIAREWELVRRAPAGTFPREKAERLLGALLILHPGESEEARRTVEAGVWQFDADDDEGRWIPDPELTEAWRTSAAYTLAVVLARTWRFRAELRHWLREWAKERNVTEDDAKVELCAVGLLEACGTGEREGVKGRLLRGGDAVRPVDGVSARRFLRWLAAYARNRAEEALVRPKELQGPIDAPDSAENLGLQSIHDARHALGALRAAASPRQLEILEAIEQAYAAGARDASEARRMAAEMLGMSESTLRGQLHRLRKKAAM
jgi:hypothetical protein